MRRIIWIMGPPGSGKTTIAEGVRVELADEGWPVVLLDAEHMRQGPMADLGFSDFDRLENITRLAMIADLLERRGPVVIVAAVTPTRRCQELARLLCGPFLVFLNGRSGPLWPGSVSFQKPNRPDLEVDNSGDIDESVEKVRAAFEELRP